MLSSGNCEVFANCPWTGNRERFFPASCVEVVWIRTPFGLSAIDNEVIVVFALVCSVLSAHAKTGHDQGLPAAGNVWRKDIIDGPPLSFARLPAGCIELSNDTRCLHVQRFGLQACQTVATL